MIAHPLSMLFALWFLCFPVHCLGPCVFAFYVFPSRRSEAEQVEAGRIRGIATQLESAKKTFFCNPSCFRVLQFLCGAALPATESAILSLLLRPTCCVRQT